MNRLTFSKLELVEACGFAFNPAAPEVGEISSTDAAIGNAYHGVYATVVNHGMGSGPAQLVDAEIRKAGLDPEKYRAQVQGLDPVRSACALAAQHCTLRAEVAVAFDPTTGEARDLGQEIDRAYVLKPGEIAGTADLVWTEVDPVNREVTLVVADHKSGFRSEWTVTPAERNAQLAALAVALSRLVDCDRVRVELRFPKDGAEEVVDAHTYSLLDLAEVEDRIVELAKRPESSPEPTPGIHCTQGWCPIRATCPATTQAMDKIVPAEGASEDWPIAITDASQIQGPRHAAWIIHRAKAVETAARILIEACKRWSDANGPVPLDGGQQWGPIITQPNETIDGDVDGLVATLSQHLPADAARSLVRAKVGKGELGKACRAAAPPRKGSKLEEVVLEALRAAKYARRDGTPRIEYRVHDVPPTAVIVAKKDVVAA